MAALVIIVLILAMTGHSSATWCVCKEGLSDAVLQKSLDYACGAGADCNPIHQNGVCWSPNSVRAHCSYAVNSYYQRKGQSGATCDFAGSAAISTSDPSISGCVYPSSQSAAGTSTTPVTTTPSTTTPSTTTPSTTTPSTTTPSTTTPTTAAPYTTTPSSTGVYGTGLGSSGINTDVSHGGLMLRKTTGSLFSFSLALLGLVFL